MVRRLQVVFGLAVLVAVAFAAASAGQGPPGGSPPGLDKAIAAKEKHAQKLLDKPGVAGVGVTLNRGGKPVVEIYKERDDVADLPSDLDGVPVESVTTGMIKPRSLPTDRFARPVPIGVSGGLAGVATGTLGVRVTDGTNVYVLSNNHVLAGVNTGSIGDPIIQPGDADGGSDPGDRIATLAAYQTIDFNGGLNTMDAAIALSSTANFATATPDDGYGDPSAVTTPAFIGQGVQKYGRTTGLQLGDVAATDVSVDVCYIALGDFCFQEARFVGQFTISPGPFSAPGDSGSLIVTQGTNQPVGLLFAGGDGLTVASPIDPVLQRFGVTIDGAPPGDGPPGAPRAFAALAGAGSVSLSWTAPTFDGGSPITNYKVYRGASAGAEAFLSDAGNATTFVDTTAANGTTYYYKVSAENANGESPLSSEVSATPTSAVVPAEPLPTVDDFNRPNENPLSDANRWTNGVVGSETGLFTTSNTLACSKSTTCTAWRNATQYGPDVEVWTRISALPGVNNHVRLYARLKEVGTSAFDGYMLRTNQLSGTDQIYVERIDNGSIVNRLTVNQELSVGDLVLLRVKGSTLEIWRNAASTWTRLGVVQDSTYAATGYVGIGLRGTSGRLDDFGARTFGAPAASTPSAPQALQATPGNAQVALAWSAPSSNGGASITGYTVYRGIAANPTAVLQAGVSTTSYTDLSAANGTTYYYRVTASNAVGESPYSNEVSAAPSAPASAPSAPQALQATPGNAQVALAWSAPSSNGGSSITGYTVYRGIAANPTAVLQAGVSTTSYTDLSAANGTTYYYRVTASNAVGESPYSNEVSAAPIDFVPPAEPLSILDTFDRANETPLSFADRWGNGILGNGERSLKVVSNQCAGDSNTTATAWWKTQLAPDQEAYATMSTLPGNGNAFRLYTRLQTPGSSAADGYMLLYSQANGTDQVIIYRMTNGGLAQLATTNRELGAGTRLLFRAKGTALEAWVREGLTWSRIVRTTDATYTGPGYAGIGIRGKTGRLDDFGAR